MRNIKSIISAIMLSVFVINLSGCATGSALVTGVKRDAISPEQVRVYHSEPSNYDVIAIVKSSSAMGFGEQHNVDLALEEIKEQAAKVGANGIILQSTQEVSTGGGGTFIPNGYGGGFFISNNSVKQTISGTAIYVK
jgi:hypothetical protein